MVKVIHLKLFKARLKIQIQMKGMKEFKKERLWVKDSKKLDNQSIESLVNLAMLNLLLI
jgi:hypothetical protein